MAHRPTDRDLEPVGLLAFKSVNEDHGAVASRQSPARAREIATPHGFSNMTDTDATSRNSPANLTAVDVR
jgi:hypothetical protein